MRISDWSSDVCSSDLMAKFAKHIRQTLTNQILIVDHQNTKPIRRLQFHHITLMHFHRLFCGLSFRKPDRSNRPNPDDTFERSEEHTSGLQSLMRISYAVFCLKKKKKRDKQKQKLNNSKM